MSSVRCLWVLITCLLAPTFVFASPAEELLRLVPDDAGFCLVVNDLRGNTQKLLEARWARAIMQSPLGRAIGASPELEKLRKFGDDLKTHLQIDWPQLRDEILGHRVVFAYRPGSEGGTKKEQGLLLVRSPKPKLLSELIDRLQQIQQQTGELRELAPIDWKGTVYYRRVERKTTNYYWLNDGVLAFSPQEELIQSAIERSKAKAASRFARQIEQARAEDAFVVLCVNPRAFDADIEQKLQQGEEKDRHVLSVFQRYWQALDAFVLAARLGNENELTASFQGRAQDLPAGSRLFLEQLAVPSELWSRFPDNAILRTAGRVDVAALLQALGEFAPPNDRQAALDGLQRFVAGLDLNLDADVLPNLGPDMGVCITAAPEKNKVPFVIAALAIKPGAKQVDRVLFQALSSALWLASVNHNMRHDDQIVMKTRLLEGAEVKVFVNDKLFPPGFEPAIALKDGYLLLVSHPEAIALFRKAKAAPAAPAENTLVHLSLSQLAENLRNRRDEFARHLFEKRGIPQQTVVNVVDTLVGTMQLFERVTISQRAEAGQAFWTLRLQSR